jgi:hypothetical protein
MNKGLLFFILGWGLVAVSGLITWWHSRLPEDEKLFLFSVILVALFGAFILGVWLHPYVTR